MDKKFPSSFSIKRDPIVLKGTTILRKYEQRVVRGRVGCETNFDSRRFFAFCLPSISISITIIISSRTLIPYHSRRLALSPLKTLLETSPTPTMSTKTSKKKSEHRQMWSVEPGKTWPVSFTSTSTGEKWKRWKVVSVRYRNRTRLTETEKVPEARRRRRDIQIFPRICIRDQQVRLNQSPTSTVTLGEEKLWSKVKNRVWPDLLWDYGRTTTTITTTTPKAATTSITLVTFWPLVHLSLLPPLS